MDDQDDDGPMDPETVAALRALANAVAGQMLATVHEEKLSPLGAMFSAIVGVKVFSKAAQQIEGWSEVQREGYLREALEDALKHGLRMTVVGAAQH